MNTTVQSHTLQLFTFLFVIVFGTSFAYLNPHKDPNICGRPVCNPIRKFNFTRDTIYEYKYTVDIKSLFAGSSKNESTLYITSLASITFITECEAVLRVSDIKLSEEPDGYDREEDLDIESPEHPNSNRFASDIEQYQLRFAFHDGQISEVCPEYDESNWVLNFKRGLLSMFQNTMERFDMDHTSLETDINGVCNTEYLLNGAQESSLVIDKRKDITSCQNRYKHHSILQTVPYNFRSGSNQIPIMQSTSECTMVIDHSIYINIICKERHMFKPFSNQDSGATTITRQQLQLQREGMVSPEDIDMIGSRKSLLYDHLPTPKISSGELKHSRSMLKDMCTYSKGDIQIEFSDVFSKFIQYARLLPYSTLQLLFSRSHQICETGKKHILDALPFLGTDASVQVMKDIILSKEVDEITAKEWLFSFAFIPRPTLTMLDSMTQLLQQEKMELSLPLSIGTMVHMYCRWAPDCGYEEIVRNIVTNLEENIRKNYKSRFNERITRDKLLINVKGLGNTGLLSDDFETTFRSMISDSDLPMEIRVAVVNAHRRQVCSESQEFFMKLYTNFDMDTEIRIAAYLQAMNCPNYGLLQKIRHTLIAEEVNQVGSFVWTHLTNLLKSSVPSRVEIQGLLSDKDLGRKFSSDVRKFSHNYEGSVFFEEYNAGGSYDINTIFSPKSYVPRQLSLNLTACLFGESINLFEINTRHEGFEHYLESFFGPNRTFSAKNIKERITKVIDKNYRFARSVDDNEVIQNQIAALPNVVEDNFDQPQVTFGMKFFGNELMYNSFIGDQEIYNGLQKLNIANYLKRILSGKEIAYNKAFVFLDTSYIVPSGTGLPVTLNAAGTAALNLKMTGMLKTDNFIKTGILDLKGHLRPSMAVDVIGTMSVDAYYASTGIKVKSNLYSSYDIEGDIKIRGPQLISVQFKLPQKKTEIFGAQSELIIMKGDKEEYQNDVTGDPLKQSYCTWPILDRTIGLKMCTDFKFPNATSVRNHSSSFLFHGPTKIRMYVEKADPTADVYFLQYRWDRTPVQHSISLHFDTPGSRVNRMTNANFTLNFEHQNVSFIVTSNKEQFSAVGHYKNTDEEKSIELSIDVDGKKHFNSHLGYKIEPTLHGNTYYPKIYLGVNAERIVELSGSLRWQTKKNVSQCDVDVKFETKKLKAQMFGYISKTENFIEANIEMNYKFEEKKEENIKLHCKLSQVRKTLFKSVTGELRLETTAYPHLNFISALKYQKASGHIECKIEMNNGPKMDLEENKLTILTVFSCFKTNNGTKLNTFLAITRPSSQVDVKFQVQHSQIGADTNTRVLVRYAEKKEVIVTLYLSMPYKPLFEIDLALNVTVPSFTPMMIEVQIDEKHKSVYDLHLKGVWFSGHMATAKGHYQDWTTPSKSEHSVKLRIESPSFTDVLADAQYYRDNNNYKINIELQHEADIYALQFKHQILTATDIVSYAAIQYKQQIYSATSTIDIKDKRQLTLELHFDQLRDIYMAFKSVNLAHHKFLGGEIKWDSNRDPSQKLGGHLEYFRYDTYNTSGNFLFTYPGRAINGHYAFAIRDTKIRSSARFAWHPTKVIDVILNSDFKHDDEQILLKLHSELLTPFVSWEKTSFNGGIYHRDNLYRVNGSVYWRYDQFISTDLFTNYSIGLNTTEAEFKTSLHSTIKDIPSIACNLKHYQDNTKLDQKIYLMYNPNQIIVLNSTWIVEKENEKDNFLGTMSLSTPFDGYKRGILQSKISFTARRNIQGYASLDLDNRHYTATCEGHLTKLTHNLFVFNVTTPMPKYKTIRGRFGINEEERHLEAVIKYPVGGVGIEILFKVHSLSHFDILLDLGTPLDFLTKLLLIAKLQDDALDFRVGWNRLLVGFAGVWRYDAVADFEYVYKLYTPIEGVEENGIVARLIYDKGIDSEMSIQLANTRLGFTVLGQPKPKILQGLGMKPASPILLEPRPRYRVIDSDEEEDVGDNSEPEDVDDRLSWAAQVEVDIAIYPTIKGVFDIDEVGPLYTLIATISLPDGNIDIRDEFNMEDVFTMNNRLLITTPFINYNRITSKYDFEIAIGRNYLVGMDFNYKNDTEWVSIGYEVNYNLALRDDEELEVHTTRAHLHTPFISLPRLDIEGRLEIDENHYRGNASLETNTTQIDLTGMLEKDEGFLDSNLRVTMTSPFLVIEPTILLFKKDYSEVENSVEFGLEKVAHPDSPFKVELMWQTPTKHKIITAKLRILTPSVVLHNFEVSSIIERDLQEQSAFAKLRFEVNDKALEVNGTLKDNVVRSEISTFIEPYKSVSLVLNQLPDLNRPGYYNLQGQMIVKKNIIEVGGVYVLQKNMLAYFKIQSKNGVTLEYKITPQTDGFQCFITMNDPNTKMDFKVVSRVEFIHKLDWFFKLETESSNPKWNQLGLETEIRSPQPHNITVNINTNTQLPGLETIHADFNLLFLPNNAGVGVFNYDIEKYQGTVEGHWNWILLENMQLKLLADYKMPNMDKNYETHIFYINPEHNLSNLTVGGEFNVDKHDWTIGSNITFMLGSSNDLDGEFNLKLPKPNPEVHTIRGEYHKFDDLKTQNLRGLLRYTTVNSLFKYAISGALNNNERKNVTGGLKLEWGPKIYQTINNNLELFLSDVGIYNYRYDLFTPKYLKENTFTTFGTYGRFNNYHNVTLNVRQPESVEIFSTQVDYQTFSNMNGTVNATTPFITFPYIGAHFDAKATSFYTKRYVEAFWPNNTAIFDSIYNYFFSKNNRGGKGKLLIEVPLTTRHYLTSNYGYNEKPNHKDGYATMDYNSVNIVNGKYNCESELRAGFQKDIINLEVENKLQPIGINYVHQIDTEAPIDGFVPKVDFKRAEIFKLNNKTTFNVTSEFTVQSTLTGEKYRLMAHHMNRTVILSTDYDILDQQFLNKARLDLAPDIWFAYDLNLLNKTYDFNSESQQIELELAYPRRNVTVLGAYNVSSKSLASELSLTWDKWTQLKTVEAALDWTKVSTYPNHHQALFELRHPSFEKNVTFLGEYKSDKINVADVKLEIDYALDPDHKVEIGANIQDHCVGELRNYTFGISGSHPATRLELMMKGGLDYRTKYYHTFNEAAYKRTYLPLQSGESSATVNVRENEIELKKATQRDLTYFWIKGASQHPVYSVNSTLVYGQDTDGRAEFYLNLKDKIISLEGNRTPDATESVHMLGKIPNARGAVFDFYRDYDDIRIYDVTYYLQLNHSRLITSRLLWRPEIKQDLKDSFKQASQSLYDMAVENIEYWKSYIRSETGDAVADIWADAKPLMQGFLDDMNDLNVLEEDLAKFKLFLNESYNNNEFYIRDAVSFATYLIDELAIRDHIESVPEIVNEIWEIMGESGKALRKSLQWLVATIKESYAKLVQFINGLMHGEALDQISNMMEYFIKKYDKFIKDLHVMFISYVEKLWTDTSVMLINHWNRMLAAIEPTFLKFIHYGETVIWNASKEFLDFLYKRKHEIEESPYFMHIANFTQDVDRFYKDMIHNSVISNIRKYSKIVWQFIKDKYFSMIPFGKELSKVFNEIVTELQELKKLPSLQFLITKYDEMYDRLVWFYEYMKIGDLVQKIITVLHMKITEITQTALDQENRYREAKTKFIFNPETGIMELEQKLPMSWHAFNETPKFMEIPEIRAINDAQNYLVMSNKSFWMLYYQYKPYTEPHTWVPPFDSYAMVVGPQHFVTFDGQHYDFSGSCSYLLANDFMDGNFSMIINYIVKDKVVKHKIDLLIDDVLIEVDLFADNVKLLKKGVNTKLPLQLEKAYIYRKADTIMIESLKGFMLKCNLKFDICKFHLSGWYFGKTAGLWGTMNNEPRDDHLASTKRINNNIGRFAQSWSLQPKKCRSTNNQAKIMIESINENVTELCEAFFKSKVSPLNTCFPIVNALPYYNLCMNYPNGDNRTSCTAAVAYMEACKLENTPLRIPDVCVQCQSINGTEIPEGQFLNLDAESVPKSADIVFIVEAKECNGNITTQRNINQVVSLIQKELTDLKLSNNRYALVVFGGPGIYSEPRSIIVNNQIFTTPQTIPHYFENIPTGNGSSDIFNAISFAKELIFRPGVSKTMILLPCTDCQANNMKLDYPVLHQLLRENDITLHILMNKDFVFPKSRINKIFYGIDSNTAYTKKDVKELKGDAGLRRQVKLPKADLGFCTPLALETNGSVFTATKLQNDKRGAIKKFATVFAKRVAQSAIPNSCQTCECTANSDGTSYMECLPCEYPTALSIDYGFNEDDSFLSYFQSATDFEDDSEEFED